MRPTLCVDVDSTIWDTGAWVCAAVLLGWLVVCFGIAARRFEWQ